MADVAATLDVSGQACPMPIVRTRQAIDKIAAGDVLEVIATDRGALSDIPVWAGTIGHRVIEVRDEETRVVFLIERGGR